MNDRKILCLIMGILGIVFCWFIFGIIFSVLGIVFSIQNIKNGFKKPIAGMVLSILSLIIGIIMIIAVVATWNDIGTSAEPEFYISTQEENEAEKAKEEQEQEKEEKEEEERKKKEKEEQEKEEAEEKAKKEAEEQEVNQKKGEQGVTGIEVRKTEENKYGNIKDFSYEISENRILLENYKGKSEILEIKSSYIIDEIEYVTDLSEFQVGIGSSKVKILILDEGITDINSSAFNSCNVESVYFPKTMSVVYDKTLSYLHPDDGEKIKVYYEGTQEEWENIFSEYERQTVKEAWDSGENPEDKGAAAGTALADKLNDWMGSGYDSSEFEYFFSASADDLK